MSKELIERLISAVEMAKQTSGDDLGVVSFEEDENGVVHGLDKHGYSIMMMNKKTFEELLNDA